MRASRAWGRPRVGIRGVAVTSHGLRSGGRPPAGPRAARQRMPTQTRCMGPVTGERPEVSREDLSPSEKDLFPCEKDLPGLWSKVLGAGPLQLAAQDREVAARCMQH
jgi:hypothetical protein